MNNINVCCAVSKSLLLFTLIITPFVSFADGTVYACVTNDQGRVRIVEDSGECKKNETERSWDEGTDLGQIESDISDLQGRVNTLEYVPDILAFPQSALIPLGPAGLGCSDMRIFSQVFKLLLIADCTSDNQIQNNYHVYAKHAPDPAYVYDGVYVCMTVAQPAIDRDDGFSDTVTVSVTPLSTSLDEVSGNITHRTTTGSTPQILVMRLGSFDESEVPILGPTDVDIPCKRFSFSDGDNPFSGITFDEWTPPGEILIDVKLPALDGRIAANPNDGDVVIIYQMGLTVAGRNSNSNGD